MKTKTAFQVASRTSDLALIMTKEVIDALKATHPDWDWRVLGIKTISDGEDKARFSTPLNEAVRAQTCRFAVHSAKDLPSVLEDDMTLCAVLKRADPRDAFISNHYAAINQLPNHAKIGTSSLRRAMLLHAMRSDLEAIKLRGNIDTRTKRAGDFDGIILAAAGLKRMQLEDKITCYLDPETFIPAPGQGAIALTCLKTDHEMIELATRINDPITAWCVHLERSLCAKINFSCHDPIGVFIQPEQGQYRLHVMLALGKQTLHRNTLLNQADLEDYIDCLAEEILSMRSIN